MSENDKKFALWLTVGIRRIWTEEVLNSGGSKKIVQRQIQEQLADAIFRNSSTIEHWRKGNIPYDFNDAIAIANELVKRGGLRNRDELRSFAVSFGHYAPEVLCDKLFPLPVVPGNSVDIAEVIHRFGIVEVEQRDDGLHSIHPITIYDKAQREIAVTGVSLFNTFRQNSDALHRALNNGKKVYVLMMHPECSEAKKMRQRERMNVQAQIVDALEIVKSDFYRIPNFEIRFIGSLPPFTAVMIDGNITSTDSSPQDQDGQIRIQPTAAHGSRHKGLVIGFKKRQEGCLFDYFAEDVRNQWQIDGRDDPELFHC